MRIRIITLYTKDWQALADIVLPKMKEYADKNGYEFTAMVIPQPYDGYKKFEDIKLIFGVDAAYAIFMIDLDILITNPLVKIEDFITGRHRLFITKDFNGINAGSFIIRKSEWTDNFIEYILSKKGEEGMYCEQDAINAYMKEFPNDEHIKILPHPSINSYKYELYPEIPPQTHEQGQWEEGDFLLHLPGVGMAQRIETFKKLSNEQ